MSFRLNFTLHATTLTGIGSAGAQTIGTWNLASSFAGQSNGDRVTALTGLVSVSGTNDTAFTVRFTFNGTGVANKTYDANVAAQGATGSKTIDESMDVVSQYQTVTVTAWNDTAPQVAPTDIDISLLVEYPAIVTGTADTGLFTITDIIDAKPPDSQITAGAYWDDIRTVAERIVRDICGRELTSATYTDKGELLEEVLDSGTRYVWYLKEPTGSAIAYSSFSAITIGGTTVATTAVLREADRLIFDSSGELVVTYPGGWMRNLTAKAIIKQAVIEVMHILNAGGIAAGFTGVAQGGGISTLSSDPYRQVRAMLSRYTATKGPTYAASPSA